MAYLFHEENFQKEVLESDIPVLVDFYADWCGPCKMMAPVLEKLADEYAGKVKIGKCDVDENMDLAEKYRVSSIPNMQLFKAGEPAAAFIGYMSEEALREKIEAAL